jgi:hypothetical protein
MSTAPVSAASLLSGVTSFSYYLPKSVDTGTPTESLLPKNMIDPVVEVYQLFMPKCFVLS